jgi:hypothetical protein
LLLIFHERRFGGQAGGHFNSARTWTSELSLGMRYSTDLVSDPLQIECEPPPGGLRVSANSTNAVTNPGAIFPS